jgi:mercuric ion transport protein
MRITLNRITLGTQSTLVGGALGAVGASLCCVAPLALVSAGIGGAWVSSLTKLEPLRPVFVLATIAFFGIAYWKLYRSPQACLPDEACAEPRVRRRQRAIFWTTLLVVVPLVAFPWFAPLLY